MQSGRVFLYKKREIGEILSDGFSFIRQNFKLLGKVLVRFLGPFFLVQVFMNSFYSYTASDIMTAEGGGTAIPNSIESFGGMTLLAIVGLVLSSILFFVVLNSVVFGIFQSYLKNDGAIEITDVRASLKKNWLRLLGATLVLMIGGALAGALIVGPMAMLGGAMQSPGLILIVMFLTGLAALVFVGVPLSLVFPVMIFDKQNVFSAITRVYDYLKGKFLITFLTFFVIYMLSVVITTVFQLPMIIYVLMKQMSGTVTNNPMDMQSDWIMMALTTLSQFFQYAISALIPIFTAFIYFNLHERKFKTGTYQKIDQIGHSAE